MGKTVIIVKILGFSSQVLVAFEYLCASRKSQQGTCPLNMDARGEQSGFVGLG